MLFALKASVDVSSRLPAATSTLLVLGLWLVAFTTPVTSLRWDIREVEYNLNQNTTATRPLDYSGVWENHTYNPSPDNWRFPFYTLFLDRFINGDPTNDDANGTAWEHDLSGTQLRNGGDIKGLQDTLDYLGGMGVKGLYLAGTPFINVPWGMDGYSPLDISLLDRHFGTIQAWREAIDEIHRHGMYIVLDNTMATLGDLVGFEGYLNVTTPYLGKEHNALWKSERRYSDFDFGNDYIEKCDYPRFWTDSGERDTSAVVEAMVGCKDSDFNQYGDVTSFGQYPQWQRSMSKFASVQDRLRDWKPNIRAILQNFACMELAMLDIDGYRMDKGTQITVDALGNWAEHVRGCALALGKKNFFISGEVVTNNAYGSIFVGRGKEPSMAVPSLSEAMTMTSETSHDTTFVRSVGKNGFDGVCFHYSFYRAMTRYLLVDGNLEDEHDTPINFIEGWNAVVRSNDFLNFNTGKFDPRHMYGAANQDVFRWPSIANGTHKQMFALYINTLHLPGIPLILWGEEQDFYVLDSTAANYLYGRMPMSSAQAWQAHGCYKSGCDKYVNFPIDKAGQGCQDDSVSLDHRDPSHPVRNIIKSMFEMRQNYPVLNDGFYLQQMSNNTYQIQLPGSFFVKTELGIWSVLRSQYPPDVDVLQYADEKYQDVWLVYQNENRSRSWEFDCKDLSGGALIAPFDSNVTVKNLFYPYEEYSLEPSAMNLGPNLTTEYNGCIPQMNLTAWGYKVFVPKEKFVAPRPVITKFFPGHDARISSDLGIDEEHTIPIEVHFSTEMNCKQLLGALAFESSTSTGKVPQINSSSLNCEFLQTPETFELAGSLPSVWKFSVQLTNVNHGVHRITINNATNPDGLATNSVDHFMFRLGQDDNPMIFPTKANYTRNLLFRESTDEPMYISHKAAGADKFRYSLNWGSSFSDWETYTGGNTTLTPQQWSGTKKQEWTGDHVIVQYWSQLTGSSAHIQHADLDRLDKPPRRFPHLSMHGTYNLYGYDAGLPNEVKQDSEGLWNFNFMSEWPSVIQANVWGMNPDGMPDVTGAYGDIDSDNILDRISPTSLELNVVALNDTPPSPYLAWRMTINDGDLRYTVTPIGSRWRQLLIFVLFAAVPIITGLLAIFAYRKTFYQVKFNQTGVDQKGNIMVAPFKSARDSLAVFSRESLVGGFSSLRQKSLSVQPASNKRQTILVATMEYDIEDWAIKIKIGGLGVMAQLMAKNLGHRDLIWVVPCVSDVDYPMDTPGEPIVTVILGENYKVQVQYHSYKNITYVLLDAPIFRHQTKAIPYPPQMDDMESAIYYSAWNTCIAEVMRRFPVDLYHINDYHGALAPLHLLPQTIPCCLSLHNAEFQGLWAIRSPQEFLEVCRVYNLEPSVVKKYVQFGEVFNLLHAGASYLRIHQKGFGAVGVSKKYGKRSLARYPIFWGLKNIGSLPNPDPSDLGEWDKNAQTTEVAVVDVDFESQRADLKRQAQEWAGLEQNADAELFVFVGRWSLQKGIDLIADVFPAILEEHPNVQLMCIGPLIDLYGKFAALKLQKMMSLYPGRVCSKPEFTMLPPFIFSGAEFALIPSRDEPFGLVAVEFGRKGALGVGSRVGGLGQMPGWWFTVESTTTKHLIKQFKSAIREALASSTEVRALMRARSAVQRFPVAQWVEDLDILHGASIKIHEVQALKSPFSAPTTPSVHSAKMPSYFTPASQAKSRDASLPNTPPQLSALSTAAPTASPSRDGSIKDGISTVDKSLPESATASLSQGKRKRLDRSHNYHFNSISAMTQAGDLTPHQHLSIPDNIPDETNLTADEIEANLTSHQLSTPRPEQSNLHHGQVITEAISRLNKVPQAILPRASSSTSLSDGNLLTPFGQRAGFSRSSSNTSLAEATHRPSRTPRPEFSRSPSVLSLADASMRNPRMPRIPLPTFSSAPSLYDMPRSVSEPTSPGAEESPPAPFASSVQDKLSVTAVVKEKKDYNLQNVDPMFTDSSAYYYREFESKLDKLSGKTSEGLLCIAEYLVSSEKRWFHRLHLVKMSKNSNKPLSAATPRDDETQRNSADTQFGAIPASDNATQCGDDDMGGYLKEGYTSPTGLKKILRTKIGDWPIYAFLLAFGQIIAANSYQITLLTGENGEKASKLYAIATVYLVSSICWWMLFRTVKSVYVLSFPFMFYGMAFALLGVAPYAPTIDGRGWVQNVATGLYATASSSGCFFFALNFGSEGSAPVAAWSFRAAVIQGVQQLYIVFLWYWGSTMTKMSSKGLEASSLITYGRTMTIIAMPIAVLLWIVGLILFFGLPDYYRQTPGEVPSFYIAACRRKIIRWFFVIVLLQNYFLSAPYGRNWAYLWSSQHAPFWTIAVLIIVFFVVFWALFLLVLGRLSRSHSWILPIFAIGLGAPRWCQMLWATSSIGSFLPWACLNGAAAASSAVMSSCNVPFASAMLGRSLWLWLGLLDTIQGVGYGIILLQTLTRLHISFALVGMQVLGSLATIVARASAPNKIGPGEVFPEFATMGAMEALGKAWFWIALVAQLVVCVGFFKFFRKEQLAKP